MILCVSIQFSSHSYPSPSLSLSFFFPFPQSSTSIYSSPSFNGPLLIHKSLLFVALSIISSLTHLSLLSLPLPILSPFQLNRVSLSFSHCTSPNPFIFVSISLTLLITYISVFLSPFSLLSICPSQSLYLSYFLPLPSPSFTAPTHTD